MNVGSKVEGVPKAKNEIANAIKTAGKPENLTQRDLGEKVIPDTRSSYILGKLKEKDSPSPSPVDGGKQENDENSNNSSSNINCNNSSMDNSKHDLIHTPQDKMAVLDAQKTKAEMPASASTSGSTLTPDTTCSGEIAFIDPRQNQVFQVLTGIQQLRKGGQFADLTVKVRDVEFRCHRFVLATNSPFLRSLIEDYTQTKLEEGDSKHIGSTGDGSLRDDGDSINNTKNSIVTTIFSNNSLGGSPSTPEPRKRSTGTGNKDVVVLKGIQPEIFDKVLDFMYCVFDDVITKENALELLLAADTFQLTYLRRTCASFVTDTLSASNVFDVITLCDAGYANLFEPKVMRRSHQVIRENFSQLSTTDEFLALSRHHMIPLIADSMLHAQEEMDVIQALLRWVKFRPEERCADLTLMLQHIRFPLMTSRELDKLREIPMLRENSLAMALVDESRAYETIDYTDRLAWPRHNCISRCLFPSRDFIMWTADRDKGLHFYSIIDGIHHKVTSFGELSMPNGFAFDSTSSVCTYADRIYFTGGEFNTDLTWSVDSSTGEVKIHAKMPRGRKFHSMVAAKGCIYCLGGQDKRGYSVLECVDAYIIDKDVWVKVGHLSVPAYNMAAVISGGAIYLVGGVDHSGQPLRIIQCFVALRSGLYSAFKVDIPNMPPSLLSARAITSGLDGMVYIVCGHGEVYRFDPEKRELNHLTTLNNLSENPRVRFGLAHMGGCLVVIGGHQLGHSVREPIRSVCLDIATKMEVRDYSPMLPGEIVNTCLAAKLNANILKLLGES
ncbi:kelch-like protein 35 [Physella acuta]|uniref:kelch-like protein 35 n=1 Tax=Physella acuta TaxID=109671 RepID=UPI0027DE0857|nr:kelch-like protein 35 [Physella acuta]